MTANRGTWGTRAGFILAAAGSAVGLGNIWGFPTQVGQGGGATFVLVYLLCVLFICMPIMIAEFSIGRRSQQSPVGSFDQISPGTSWWLVGGLGVLTGAGILSFYSVIAGWTVAYVWFTLTDQVGSNQDAIGLFFANFTANASANVALTLLVLGITALVLLGGVKSGIERVTKLLMPALIALLILLAAQASTLPGAAAGISYYLKPDFSRLLDPTIYSAALGQAFFSLSLGMGAMITYGSYLRKREGIASSAILVVLLDTMIALLAGFIIFPAGFSIPDFDPTSSGPGLIFTVLPRLFSTLPGGLFFGTTFFVLLTMAALTSMISLLEVPVSHFVDAYDWTRTRSVTLVTGVVLLFSIPSALSAGSVGFFSRLPTFNVDFLTLMSTVWNDFALPIGGLLTAIFVGWVWKIDGALAELKLHDAWFPAPHLWGFLIRWLCPLGILAIIVPAVVNLL